MAANPLICYHRYDDGEFCHERPDAPVHDKDGDHPFKRLEVVDSREPRPVWVKLFPFLIIGGMLAAWFIFGGGGAP